MSKFCRFTWSLLILLLLTIAFACSDNPTKPNPISTGPHISIPDSVFNFGYTPQSSIVSHTFRLYSTGDDTLKITRIVPG